MTQGPTARVAGRSVARRAAPAAGEAPLPFTHDASVAVAVDVVPYALRGGALATALVDARDAAGEARCAFPGGRVRVAESLEEAARRWLEQALPGEQAHLEQLYTFGEPGRDPAARVVSVAYLALLARARDLAGIRWEPADALPPLAYDHDAVAAVALVRLRAKLGYTNVARSLLPEAFTLGDLQHLYEAVLGRALDRRNFRKRVLAQGLLLPLDEARRGAHRPARLFCFAERHLVTIGLLGEPRSAAAEPPSRSPRAPSAAPGTRR